MILQFIGNVWVGLDFAVIIPYNSYYAIMPYSIRKTEIKKLIKLHSDCCANYWLKNMTSSRLDE